MRASKKTSAYLVSGVFLGLAAYPLALAPRDDGFPLSTYPMFANDKGREAAVTSAIAVGDDFEAPVPPSFVANAEAMQALVTLKKTVRAGRKASRRLCERIAGRVTGVSEFAAADHVALVTRRFDSIEYLAGAARPIAEREHVRCPIERAK